MNRRTVAIGVVLVGIGVLAAVGERALASFVDAFERDLTAFVEEATPDDLEGATYLGPDEVGRIFWTNQHEQDGLEQVGVVSGGKLSLPSGRVAAGDVFLADPDGLDRSFPPGEEWVNLLVARFADGGEVVAAAAVGSPRDVVRWVPAFAAISDEPDAELAPGYAVDSGTAAFASRETAQDLIGASGSAEILEALRDTSPTMLFTRVRPVGAGLAAGMVAFAAGYGDGAYPLWWGLDAENRPVALLTDFGVLYNGASDPGSTS